MFSFARLAGHAAACCSVLVGLCAASVGVRPFTTGSAWLLQTDSAMDMSAFDKAGAAISGVLAERRRNTADAASPLGVMMGASALREGVDPAQLRDQCHGSTRWLLLAAENANMSNLRDIHGLLTLSRLDPAELVLVVQRIKLADVDTSKTIEPAAFNFDGLIAGLTHLDLRLLRRIVEDNMVVPINLLCPNRIWVNQRIRRLVIDARIHLFDRLGLGVDRLYAPARSPWDVQAHSYEGQVSATNIQRNFEGDRDVGFYDPEHYLTDGPQYRAMVELITAARERGSRVSIVLLPEFTLVHDAVPAESLSALTATLDAAFGAERPPIHDFSHALADDRFYDLSHLNARGRQEFTQMLSQTLCGGAPAVKN
ncbi:MAG TPA: hypothetical protein VHY91_22925 [Pirellulales bacterium]|jgi:hypothetical protein|nr:hypothetical protein [Pirellulales bacterium]